MLRVPVSKIEPGMVLARPIPMPRDPHRFLLQRDHEISMSIVPRLREMGILEVWVRYPDLEFLEDVIDEGLGEHQREVYNQVRTNFESMMPGAAVQVDLSVFQSSIRDMFNFLQQSTCGNVLLQKLDAYDDYLMSHSTNVCYLALLLGMRLERYLIEQRKFKNAREAKDLQLLGLGCLLHDVGKMRIPQAILSKPTRLTDEEMEFMKLHPVYGHRMVKGRVAPAVAEVVLNHHQRWDGHGYPARIEVKSGVELPPLRETQISIFSRIATVVDVYDAATSRRCYSGAKPPVQVLHEMRTICQGHFDPVVERAFYEIVPPFPIGQIVTLSNGVEAAIVDFNPRFPCQPKVQGIRDPGGARYRDSSLHEIDLALYNDIEVAYVDDVDVRPFLASQSAAVELV